MKYFFGRLLYLIVIAAFLVTGVRPCLACTLWAAAGKTVKYRGTLIAKNRDWYLGETQRLRFIKYKKKFSYIGLFAGNDVAGSIKAGVNERGLVIVNAAASESRLYKKPYNKSLMGKLLSRCSDVQDALSHPDWFHGARFLLLADSRRISLVEIGNQGVFEVKTLSEGKLFHTNHYIEPELKFLNPNPPKKSSLARLRLIRKYMTDQKNYSFADFIAMSGLQDRGPRYSLWRSGKTPASIRTMATWIVWQPYGGRPALYVRLIDQQSHEKEYLFDLNKVFSDRRLKSENISQIYGLASGPGLD